MKKVANNKFFKSIKLVAVFCMICAVILSGCINNGTNSGQNNNGTNNGSVAKNLRISM